MALGVPRLLIYLGLLSGLSPIIHPRLDSFGTHLCSSNDCLSYGMHGPGWYGPGREADDGLSGAADDRRPHEHVPVRLRGALAATASTSAGMPVASSAPAPVFVRSTISAITFTHLSTPTCRTAQALEFWCRTSADI